jgi:hypothetical protein
VFICGHACIVKTAVLVNAVGCRYHGTHGRALCADLYALSLRWWAR